MYFFNLYFCPCLVNHYFGKLSCEHLRLDGCAYGCKLEDNFALHAVCFVVVHDSAFYCPSAFLGLVGRLLPGRPDDDQTTRLSASLRSRKAASCFVK